MYWFTNTSFTHKQRTTIPQNLWERRERKLVFRQEETKIGAIVFGHNGWHLTELGKQAGAADDPVSEVYSTWKLLVFVPLSKPHCSAKVRWDFACTANSLHRHKKATKPPRQLFWLPANHLHGKPTRTPNPWLWYQWDWMELQNRLHKIKPSPPTSPFEKNPPHKMEICDSLTTDCHCLENSTAKVWCQAFSLHCRLYWD